jgi:hypothetical protein
VVIQSNNRVVITAFLNGLLGFLSVMGVEFAIFLVLF